MNKQFKNITLYNDLNYICLPLLNKFLTKALYYKLSDYFTQFDNFKFLFDLDYVPYNKEKYDDYIKNHLNKFTEKEVKDKYFENKKIEAIK